MQVEIKWDNLDGEKYFNDKLIDLAKKYQDTKQFEKFSFLISRQANSRHLINLQIDTKNPGEQLDVLSNSYNLDNSFEILEKELKKQIRLYDPEKYEKQKSKEKEWALQAIANREKAISDAKKKLEEKENKIKAKLEQDEKNRLLEQEKQNAAILKKIEKKRLEDEKEDQEIISQLEKQKKEFDEAKKIEKENKEKLEKHMVTLKFDVIADDLEEDREIQEKVKEEKQKLRELQSEENECLAIIEQIKELERKEFNVDEYIVNEPFQLYSNWFYYDNKFNLFIANENNEWVPITKDEIKPYYDEAKRPLLDDLELKLIEARKRRKQHLKDVVNGQDLIAELEQSKQRRKQLEKEKKENLKKLKEDYENTSKQTAEELKAKIKPVEIEIAETHPANEPFLTEYNQYAYHDGEGRYFLADESGNWTETTKSNVYAKSKLTETHIKSNHQAGDSFKNSKGDSFYFDGESYYKLVNGSWELSSLAEATDMNLSDKERKKLEKKANKNKQQENGLNNTSINESNNQHNSTEEDNIQQTTSNNYILNEDGSQQWQDENGTWWYLDTQGNYYYSDGTNWIPYTY